MAENVTPNRTGIALAKFQCRATVNDPEAIFSTLCREVIVVRLVNDGQYMNCVTPQDWHIELGTKFADTDKGTDALVRCPQHCCWVTKTFEVDFDGWGNTLPGGEKRTVTEGHWEDAP